MRASRLLRILLLLQNRGRLSAPRLAEELEVATRTIYRDVDAMTEAGLPVIVHRGPHGGIELGFNYRTRLTGLDADEAEAVVLALLFSAPNLLVQGLGLDRLAERARAKLIESLPDRTRAQIGIATERFSAAPALAPPEDTRLLAVANAIRGRKIVRLDARSQHVRTVHPIGLCLDTGGWSLTDARDPDTPVPIAQWGDINISAKTFS